jgi:hypothetical protein
MREDFRKETSGEVIDFAEDPVGADKSKDWRKSLGMR